MTDLLGVPVVPWSEWWPSFCRDYGNGSATDAQHVTIVGPTGTGKSTLAMQIASRRRWVAALVAKPRDDHMKRMLRAGGFVRAECLPVPEAGRPRVFLWPKVPSLDSFTGIQRGVFRDAFDAAYRAGVWTLLADEAHHLCERLQLADAVKLTLQMGRSNGTGLILCAQRPAWLPLDAFSAPRHLIIFGTNDSRDLQRLGGLNGADDKLVRQVVGKLGRGFQFLHVDAHTGNMRISRFDKSPGKVPR